MYIVVVWFQACVIYKIYKNLMWMSVWTGTIWNQTFFFFFFNSSDVYVNNTEKKKKPNIF